MKESKIRPDSLKQSIDALHCSLCMTCSTLSMCHLRFVTESNFELCFKSYRVVDMPL